MKYRVYVALKNFRSADLDSVSECWKAWTWSLSTVFGNVCSCTVLQTSFTYLPFPRRVLCFYILMEERELLEISEWAGLWQGGHGAVAGPRATGIGFRHQGSNPTLVSRFLQQDRDAHPSSICSPNCGKFWKRWEYQTTWSASWEICMQVRKQQLELDMEQQTGSK